MNTKSFFKSKLVWLGVVNVSIGLLNYLSGHLENGTVITLNGALIIVLRILTAQGLSLKK